MKKYADTVFHPRNNCDRPRACLVAQIGELRVKRILGKTKINERYVINDVYLRSADGKSSQIDHVLISENGIFVIETKNYSGRIFGGENDYEWTQTLRFGKVKNRLYNLVKQNKTHVYRIKEVIGNHFPVFSVIVFVQNNTKYIRAENVVGLSDLKKYLSRFRTRLIRRDNLRLAYEKLLAEKNARRVTKSEHLKNIKKLKKSIANGVCPRCGGSLVLRNGKNGEFWGCSDFPRCKFVKRR